MTRLIVAIILMSTCSEGPAVSLNGSPHVSCACKEPSHPTFLTLMSR